MQTETISRRLLVENIGGVTVVSFADSELISEEVFVELEAQLGELAQGFGSRSLLLSFRGVRLMSGTMLGALLKFSKRIAVGKGRLKLCDLDPSLMEVFKVTRCDRIFEIHADESSALDSF